MPDTCWGPLRINGSTTNSGRSSNRRRWIFLTNYAQERHSRKGAREAESKKNRLPDRRLALRVIGDFIGCPVNNVVTNSGTKKHRNGPAPIPMF